MTTAKQKNDIFALGEFMQYIFYLLESVLDFVPDEDGVRFDSLTSGQLPGYLELPDGSQVPYGAWLYDSIEPFGTGEICCGELKPSKELEKLWDAAIAASPTGDVSLQLGYISTGPHETLLGLLAELIPKFGIVSDTEQISKFMWETALKKRLYFKMKELQESKNLDLLAQVLSLIDKNQ